jgi:hypothetical protein
MTEPKRKKPAPLDAKQRALQRLILDAGKRIGLSPIIAGLMGKKIRAGWAEAAKGGANRE